MSSTANEQRWVFFFCLFNVCSMPALCMDMSWPSNIWTFKIRSASGWDPEINVREPYSNVLWLHVWRMDFLKHSHNVCNVCIMFFFNKNYIHVEFLSFLVVKWVVVFTDSKLIVNCWCSFSVLNEWYTNVGCKCLANIIILFVVTENGFGINKI